MFANILGVISLIIYFGGSIVFIVFLIRTLININRENEVYHRFVNQKLLEIETSINAIRYTENKK